MFVRIQKLFLAGSLLFSGLSYAQDVAEKDVPALIRNSFKKTFPNAAATEWEMKGDLYNAEFDVDRRDHEVWLNSKGAIIKHKQEIRSREIPEPVMKTLKQNFKGYWIDDADKYEVTKQFFYKVELKTLTKEKNVVLDSKGTIVNRVL